MKGRLSSVFFAGVEIDGAMLRKYLGEHSFTLSFKEEEQMAEFTSEGETVLRITCAYESAVKLAEDLGLKSDSLGGKRPNAWHHFIDKLELYHDGSSDADELLLELWRSRVPHTVRRNQLTVAIGVGGIGIHTVPMYSKEKLLEIIRERAKKRAAA